MEEGGDYLGGLTVEMSRSLSQGNSSAPDAVHLLFGSISSILSKSSNAPFGSLQSKIVIF